MQKSLQEKVRGMLQRQKVRRRMAALLTVLSLCAAMGIFSLQMRPAATLSESESAAVGRLGGVFACALANFSLAILPATTRRVASLSRLPASR